MAFLLGRTFILGFASVRLHNQSHTVGQAPVARTIRLLHRENRAPNVSAETKMKAALPRRKHALHVVTRTPTAFAQFTCIEQTQSMPELQPQGFMIPAGSGTAERSRLTVCNPESTSTGPTLLHCFRH